MDASSAWRCLSASRYLLAPDPLLYKRSDHLRQGGVRLQKVLLDLVCGWREVDATPQHQCGVPDGFQMPSLEGGFLHHLVLTRIAGKRALEASLQSVSIRQQYFARTVTMAYCRKAWASDGTIRCTSVL